MRLNNQDKAEIRELLNKIAEQINIIEMQCDNMVEIIAEVNKNLNENEGE